MTRRCLGLPTQQSDRILLYIVYAHSANSTKVKYSHFSHMQLITVIHYIRETANSWPNNIRVPQLNSYLYSTSKNSYEELVRKNSFTYESGPCWVSSLLNEHYFLTISIFLFANWHATVSKLKREWGDKIERQHTYIPLLEDLSTGWQIEKLNTGEQLSGRLFKPTENKVSFFAVKGAVCLNSYNPVVTVIKI